MVVDGPRILFNEIGVPLSEVSSQGGDVVAVNTPFSAFFLLDISPDKTELLTAVPSVNSELDQPLWILSVASGLARRVGEIRCHAAAWSPDGQKIAYLTGNDLSGGNDLYVVAKDGNALRKLAHIDAGFVMWVRWSPNASTLRFTAWRGSSFSLASLWEVSANGTNLHPVPLFADASRSVDRRQLDQRRKILSIHRRKAVPNSERSLGAARLSITFRLENQEAGSGYCGRNQLLEPGAGQGRQTNPRLRRSITGRVGAL
jgi:dipeptidyl aminopeptidase/acylaminoacyl peptidase